MLHEVPLKSKGIPAPENTASPQRSRNQTENQPKEEPRKPKRRQSNSPPRENSNQIKAVTLQTSDQEENPKTKEKENTSNIAEGNYRNQNRQNRKSYDSNHAQSHHNYDIIYPPFPYYPEGYPPYASTMKLRDPPKDRVLQTQSHPELDDRAKGFLTEKQIQKLRELLSEKIDIVNKDASLTITTSYLDILTRIVWKLRLSKIPYIPDGIRLVGSGAAFILSDTERRDLNDVDFSFYIASYDRYYDLLNIQEIVLGELIYLQHNEILSPKQIYEQFFLDSIKVESNRESWSLITFGKKGHQTIDIKFIAKSRRSYVFSSDSFEIALEPLILPSNLVIRSFKKRENTETQELQVLVESMFGNYEESLNHLKEGLLCTKAPEELRRGIFRYCYELAKGKHTKSEEEGRELDEIFCKALFCRKRYAI